jgi:hypothetical protein
MPLYIVIILNNFSFKQWDTLALDFFKKIIESYPIKGRDATLSEAFLP